MPLLSKINFKFFYYFCIAMLFLQTYVWSVSYSHLENGSLQFKGDYTVDYTMNRTVDGWSASQDGINKKFFFTQGALESDWNKSSRNTLSLDLLFKHTDNFKGMIGVNIFGGYLDTLWRPVNDYKRLYDDRQYARFTKADVEYHSTSTRLRYFKGVGHYNWKYEGDIFGFYPEQFDTENYLNISGRTAPEAGEAEMRLPVGSLVVIGGEPIWGMRDSLYAKYNYRFYKLDNYFVARREKIPWGWDDEFRESYALNSKISYINSINLELGVMYQPFRLNEAYTYVDNVKDGEGDLGSKFKVKNGTTEEKDGIGYKIIVEPNEKLISFVDKLRLSYSHLGIVAGNKNEIEGFADKKVARHLSMSLKATWRKPLISANPYLYEGTELQPGPAYIVPRGEDAPFRVDMDNREATLTGLFITYDPSAKSNFYKYEPANLEAWNINDAIESPFACALGYSMNYYPTSTDRTWYYNADGKVIWEPSSVYGLFGFNTPLHYIDFVLRSSLGSLTSLTLVARGGNSPVATGSYSYANDEDDLKPTTNMLSLELILKHRLYKLELGYGSDTWGPESWHREFGIVVNQLYKASIKRDLKGFGELGVSYVGVREDDNKINTVDIGSFDEVTVSWAWKFNSILHFKEPEERIGMHGAIIGDKAPPQVEISLAKGVLFTPNNDGINDLIDFHLYVYDYSGIDEWWISIRDKENKEISRIYRKGRVPDYFSWDGIDEATNKLVPEGHFNAVIGATDVLGNKAESKPVNFILRNTQKVFDKEAINKLKKRVDIREDARGLILTITARDIFEPKKAEIKDGGNALINDIVAFMKGINITKIKIEGYTDKKGLKRYNGSLSQGRAETVAGYMASAGIDSSIITSVGLGEKTPITKVRDKEAIEKNNRIEIVIMR
ncbi:MAG: OmpA family protein [Elusimicrobiota bacterium]